jgi:hypothetical protein
MLSSLCGEILPSRKPSTVPASFNSMTLPSTTLIPWTAWPHPHTYQLTRTYYKADSRQLALPKRRSKLTYKLCDVDDQRSEQKKIIALRM